MDEWISVKDRLPVISVGVLLTDGFIVSVGELTESYHFSGFEVGWENQWSGHGFSGNEWKWKWYKDDGPTHWAVLPLPPKKGV